MAIRLWWLRVVAEGIDRQAVIETIAEESGLSPRYAFMILMSAGIAVLGLRLSSPAVEIGAMLISPLMNPILGFGFSLATFDFGQTRRSLAALAVGSILAIALTGLIVLLSPLREATSEILARTRPNLFDLLVALFAALAGTFAIINGRGGTIVGVAIATALMPPLAVVGYGLATWNMPVLGGAAALFVTNFVTIALAATIMARLYGFGRAVSAHHSWIQSGLTVLVFLVLAVPLGFSLSRIAREAVMVAEVRAFLTQQFGARSRITQLSVKFDAKPLAVRAVVITPRMAAKTAEGLQPTLEHKLGEPISLQLDQVLLAGAANTLDAQRAQLLASEAADQAAKTSADRVATTVALAAGIPVSQVTVDRDHKLASASAAVLPGADLQTYRALEQRAAAAAPDWRIALVPPFQALPLVRFAKVSDTLDDQARIAILTAGWAAKRWNIAALGVPGLPAPDAPAKHLTLRKRRAEAVAELLKSEGVQTSPAAGGGQVLRLSLGTATTAP